MDCKDQFISEVADTAAHKIARRVIATLQGRNWLRVFGNAEASRMGSGVGQQRYTSAVRSEKWRDSVAA